MNPVYKLISLIKLRIEKPLAGLKTTEAARKNVLKDYAF
jgi:hypothetical protein